jgi:hypothetical protein
MYIVTVRETIETAFTLDCDSEDQAKSVVMQYLDGHYMDSGPFIDKEEVYTNAVEILSVKEEEHENESP